MDIEKFVVQDEKRMRLFGDVWRDLIPKVFADVPKYYDQGNALASLGLCARWSERFVSEIAVAENAVVLDVCSGTHEVARRLLRHKPGIAMYAVDRSPEMTEEGQRLAQASGLSINATIADVHTLPYDDAVFDAVTLQFATRHLRVTSVFKEIHRVLKPGGIFYHSDMLRPHSRVIEKPYLGYLHILLSLTATLFGSTEESRRCVTYFTESIKTYFTPDEMSDLLGEIGFENISHHSFLTGVLSRHVAQKKQS